MLKLKRLLLIIILLTTGLSACSSQVSTDLPTTEVVSDPGILPSDIAKLEILFVRRVSNETAFHITSLDQLKVMEGSLAQGGRDLELSPAGDLIVFQRLETVEDEYVTSLWVKDLSDGVERRIILWNKKLTEESLASPSFFPGGTRIVFSVNNYSSDTTGLAAINLDGTGLDRISVPQNSFNIGPLVSPDNNKILVVCEGLKTDQGGGGFMLCIMDPDGSERSQLTDTGDYHGNMFFTHDSQTIIYTETNRGGLLGVINPAYYHIMRMKSDGTDKQLILPWNNPVEIKSISKDGNWIAFLDSPDKDLPASLYLYHQTTKQLLRLSYFDQFLTEWYADIED